MENNVFEYPYNPDTNLRRCYDCGYMKSTTSWWCVNENAIEERGTRIPGIYNCPYWKPAYVHIPPISKEKKEQKIRFKRFFSLIKPKILKIFEE